MTRYFTSSRTVFLSRAFEDIGKFEFVQTLLPLIAIQHGVFVEFSLTSLTSDIILRQTKKKKNKSLTKVRGPLPERTTPTYIRVTAF